MQSLARRKFYAVSLTIIVGVVLFILAAQFEKPEETRTVGSGTAMELNSKSVQTVGNFTCIVLHSGSKSPAKDVLNELHDWKQNNPDKRIVNFQIEFPSSVNLSHRIFIQHEPR